MRIFFKYKPFDIQLNRALSYTVYGGADIGECLTTAARIKEGDINSWYIEWTSTAERLYETAERSFFHGHDVSAREAYLRASNYYRASMFFHYRFPLDMRVRKAYERHEEAFDKAGALFSPAFEKIQIPYESITLSGNFYKANTEMTPRPTLIVNNGYDGTHQENYFAYAIAGLRRGYHVLCFDGPGQGGALIKEQLYMRHDWEKVISPVIDYLLKRKDVDGQNIILIGPSWGSLLAARASAYDTRINCLILNPGQYDPITGLRKKFPWLLRFIIPNGPQFILKFLLNLLMKNKSTAREIKSKLWVHGLHNPVELVYEWKKFSLRNCAQLIKCPVLVCDAENEYFSKGQAKILFKALSCPKEYLFFSTKEGAGEHCEAGANSLLHQRMFDWLDKKCECIDLLVKDF